jgi:hypothetical protein
MKVFVATVPTYYEVMAVAETEAEARRLAAKKAHQFLKDREALTEDTDTPSKVAEYFGINVTGIEIGSAVFS